VYYDVLFLHAYTGRLTRASLVRGGLLGSRCSPCRRYGSAFVHFTRLSQNRLSLGWCSLLLSLLCRVGLEVECRPLASTISVGRSAYRCCVFSLPNRTMAFWLRIFWVKRNPLILYVFGARFTLLLSTSRRFNLGRLPPRSTTAS